MKNRQKMPLQISDRVAVTFREVAVHFSNTDWECLNAGQKQLYMDVVKDVHKALISLGYEIVNSQVFIRIRNEEKENVENDQVMEHESGCRNSSTSSPAITPDVILVIKKEKEVCDWRSYGDEPPKIESAAPLLTSVTSLAMKEEEELFSREQDMVCRRVKQEERSTWDWLARARGHIQAEGSPGDLVVDHRRSTQEVFTLRDPDTARGGGTLKEQNPGILCDNYEANGIQKTVSGVPSAAFKQHMPLQEEKLICGETDPRIVKEDCLVDIMSHQNKRKLNSEGETSILHKRKHSKEMKREEQDLSSPSDISTQFTGTARLQALKVDSSIDPSNVFTHSLSGHNLWERTLEEMSSGSNGSELCCPMEVAACGRNRNEVHPNSWISAMEKAVDSSNKRTLQHTICSNTMDNVAEGSGLNEQTGKLEEVSEDSRETMSSNDAWKYTSDKGALDNSGIECSQKTWGIGKNISSKKTIPHLVETLPTHGKSFLMIQPDAGIQDFLSNLREDQRQTIRSFMKILLNLIDQESVMEHSVSPLLPPQSQSIQLQSAPVLTIQPPSNQIKSDQNKSNHLHSSQEPAQPQSTKLRTAQSHSLQQQPSISQTLQSRVVQKTLCQQQPIQLHSTLSVHSQPVQLTPIASQSAHPQSVHSRLVKPHSLPTESSPICPSLSKPVQRNTIQSRAVPPPHSIHLQAVQPLTGQSWSAQPHFMDSQSPSAQATPPQCFLPQPIQSLPLCKTSSLQGSATSEKIPLVVDPVEPERFSSVSVDKQHLRRLLIAAEGRVKKQAAFLLNGLIKLLFMKEELACSDGLGLRGKKSNSLDQVKVDAMREFLHSKCVERKWNQLDGNRFTRIITNKISNARRDLKQGNKGLKGLQDTIRQTQANTRSEKKIDYPVSNAVHPLPPLQRLDNNHGQDERTLNKEGLLTDSDSGDCILTS